jgi:RNase H-like domain found in reverse transcriptase
MSIIAVPLYEMTVKYDKFNWIDQIENSFNALKECLADEVSLHLPDYTKRFILETDTSDTRLVACLMQNHESARNVPIKWASRKLTKAETNYAITGKNYQQSFGN